MRHEKRTRTAFMDGLTQSRRWRRDVLCQRPYGWDAACVKGGSRCEADIDCTPQLEECLMAHGQLLKSKRSFSRFINLIHLPGRPVKDSQDNAVSDA
jgi:hypothetical protein